MTAASFIHNRDKAWHHKLRNIRGGRYLFPGLHIHTQHVSSIPSCMTRRSILIVLERASKVSKWRPRRSFNFNCRLFDVLSSCCNHVWSSGSRNTAPFMLRENSLFDELAAGRTQVKSCCHPGGELSTRRYLLTTFHQGTHNKDSKWEDEDTCSQAQALRKWA